VGRLVIGALIQFPQPVAAPVAGQPPTLVMHQVAWLHPYQLTNLGCNIHVEVATSSAFVNSAVNPAARKSLQVFAHFDTGASQTTISPVLAQHLGLVQTGAGTTSTANGLVTNPTYAVDLQFLNCSLKSRLDLQVGSCTLPFSLAAHQAAPGDPKNFALLIGRDIMSAWHVAWDGPSSTVIISD
jgi:hypothetical protein